MAVAIYSGAAAAEKEARKEALDDIARLVRDESLISHLQLGRGIYRLFRATFGEKHLSWKCITRSVMATVAFCLSLGLQFSLSTGVWLNSRGDWGTELLLAFSLGICLDYVSLLKTRILLRRAATGQPLAWISQTRAVHRG